MSQSIGHAIRIMTRQQDNFDCITDELFRLETVFRVYSKKFSNVNWLARPPESGSQWVEVGAG